MFRYYEFDLLDFIGLLFDLWQIFLLNDELEMFGLSIKIYWH